MVTWIEPITPPGERIYTIKKSWAKVLLSLAQTRICVMCDNRPIGVTAGNLAFGIVEQSRAAAHAQERPFPSLQLLKNG